jgi:hypothetical protein
MASGRDRTVDVNVFFLFKRAMDLLFTYTLLFILCSPTEITLHQTLAGTILRFIEINMLYLSFTTLTEVYILTGVYTLTEVLTLTEVFTLTKVYTLTEVYTLRF